jgi:hypothetical protein
MPTPGGIAGGLGLGLLGDHRLGRDQRAPDRRRVLQRVPHDLGRIDNVG